ncbi:MAG: hypothetical protein C4325_03005 [Blastocatellia bacterium]
MQFARHKESDHDEQLLELSSRIDEFEQYTYAHGLRIAEISEHIAVSIGLNEFDRNLLRTAALLHDIGEMAMNRPYIAEDRRLNEIEMLDMRRHPIVGEYEAAKLGLGRGVQLLIRWHHEWWNGDGYPDRLSGDKIPIASRILRLADCFASMTDQRPGRRAHSASEAAQYLVDSAAIEFDPAIVRCFLDLRLYETSGNIKERQ